ncbi:MAG: hypothetical protein Alpg2KO_10890 [Alphaproteobacteria bacterium]
MHRPLVALALMFSLSTGQAFAQDAASATPAEAAAQAAEAAATDAPDRPISMEELGAQIEAAEPSEEVPLSARDRREPEIPTIEMYWAVMSTDDENLKALLRVYIGGLSDGFYSYERIRQKATADLPGGPRRHFCYGDPAKYEGGPSRQEAVQYFEEFAEMMAMGQRIERVATYPIMTTFSVMYRYKFLCDEDAAPIALNRQGLPQMRPLVMLGSDEGSEEEAEAATENGTAGSTEEQAETAAGPSALQPEGEKTPEQQEQTRRDRVPHLSMFWVAEQQEVKAAEAHAKLVEQAEDPSQVPRLRKTPEWLLVMAYMKGVSDGVFALDHARFNRFGRDERAICYEEDKMHGLPPTREQIASSLRRFMFKLFDTVGEEKTRHLPIPLILPQAMLKSYRCKANWWLREE